MHTYFGLKAQNSSNKLQQSCNLLLECTPKKASPKVLELCVNLHHKNLFCLLCPQGRAGRREVCAWLFLKRTQKLVSITTQTWSISLLQQKGVADFHKNCFLSPVKSNDAIVKNFFFPVRYAQGEYVGVKKILIRALINSGIKKQILGLQGTLYVRSCCKVKNYTFKNQLKYEAEWKTVIYVKWGPIKVQLTGVNYFLIMAVINSGINIVDFGMSGTWALVIVSNVSQFLCEFCQLFLNFHAQICY